MRRSKTASLFDHLVGGGEQPGGNLEFEASCGLDIDDQLKLGRPVDGQVRRLRAFEDATGIESGAAIRVSGVVPIADHAASHREVAGASDHRNIVSRRQHRELTGASGQERIGCNDHGAGLALHQRLERRIDLARGAGLEHLQLQPGHTGGCLSQRLLVKRRFTRFLGLTITAIRVAAGTSSRTNSRCFAPSSTLNQITPVTFPSGWLKLLTSPARTGSAPLVNTIGIVVVSDFATRAVWLPPVAAMTATRRAIRSAASARNRSG